MIPPVKLNAGFAHMAAKPGNIALLSQSGAIATSLIDWAAENDVGFSHIVSLGDMADVDVGDWLDMLAGDARTRAIVMYLETIPNARKFMSAARAAARIKPVIAVKSGRHEAAAKAAATHTGALSGADRVVDAALQRAGILRVDGLAELFDAAEITARFAPLDRARVGIVTNGGGAGVLAVDQLIDCKGELAELAPPTIERLNAALPPTWSHANPVDIIGDAPPERYKAAVEAVAADPGTDVVMVLNCPTGLASPAEAARAVAGLASRGQDRRQAGRDLLAGRAHGGRGPPHSPGGRAGELRDAGRRGDSRLLSVRLVAGAEGADARAVEPQRGRRRPARSGAGDLPGGGEGRAQHAHRAGGQGGAGSLWHPGARDR